MSFEEYYVHWEIKINTFTKNHERFFNDVIIYLDNYILIQTFIHQIMRENELLKIINSECDWVTAYKQNRFHDN